MTQKEFTAKIKVMAKEHQKALLKECERLYNSGGVDTKNAENNFILPKTIIYVALLNEASQYKPLSKESQKDVRNLIHF